MTAPPLSQSTLAEMRSDVWEMRDEYERARSQLGPYDRFRCWVNCVSARCAVRGYAVLLKVRYGS